MTAWSRRGAWGLVLLVLVGWLGAFVLSAAGVAPRADSGEPLGGDGSASEVVLIGIPGLTWDDVDPSTMPTISGLAQEGGSAALVLRGVHEVTCSADAWLTLGTGQRAATDVEGCEDAAFEATPTNDRPAPVLVDEVVQGGTVDPDVWDRWRRSAEGRALDAELGTLARLAEEGGTCVAAYGAEAVLGAAGPDGAAAVAVPSTGQGLPQPAPGRAGTSSTPCRVHLVSAPPLPAAEVDAAVADVHSALPAGTTLVVAGLGHIDGQAEAMALIVHPAGDGEGASLSSGTTQQRGLVQLTDLAPTLLRLAGVELPDVRPDPLAGQPLASATVGDRHVAQTRDLAAGASMAKSSAPWVLGAVGAVVLVPLVITGLLRRGMAFAVVSTVAMAVPVATFLAGLVPWWRSDSPVVLALVVAGLAVLVAAVAWAGLWRRHPLGPPAVVSAITLVVLGVDMMWSARLGLVSVLGLQPVTAGRFYGQGNVGFGIALGAFLVLAGTLMTWLGRDGGDGSAEHLAQDGSAEHHEPAAGFPAAAVAVGLLGGAFTIIGAAPWGGADFGGVLAVVVATGLLGMAAVGLRWSVRSLLALGLLGVAVAATVMVLDWLRGPERRTHLGEFVQRVIDGEALGIVTRKLDQSLGILISYPLSWLAVIALVLVALVVVRRPDWSEPLWRHRGLHPTAVAGLVAIALAWALNDSGIAVVALALTMLIAAALAVLGRELASRQ